MDFIDDFNSAYAEREGQGTPIPTPPPAAPPPTPPTSPAAGTVPAAGISVNIASVTPPVASSPTPPSPSGTTSAVGSTSTPPATPNQVAVVGSTPVYSEIVEIAREYIRSIGGFEKFAEWGLV